jgi:hypothetical protein
VRCNFLDNVIDILMETTKDFYSSTTTPPPSSAAVATNREALARREAGEPPTDIVRGYGVSHNDIEAVSEWAGPRIGTWASP